MVVENVKWELSELYKYKAIVESAGRSCGFFEQERIKKMQNFLDDQSEEKEEVKINSLSSDDAIPF